MREIKFRVWDKDEKCWVSFVDDTYDYVWALTLDGQFIYTSKDRIYPQEHWVMTQYTGLKDKQGIEIYEGDIVDYNNKFKLLIEFSDVNASFIAKRVSDETMLMNFRKNMAEERLEVIGNVYENPELLEPQK